MASNYSHFAAVDRVDYMSTKTALPGLTRIVAVPCARTAIICDTISPGTGLTAATNWRLRQEMRRDSPSFETVEENFGRSHGLDRHLPVSPRSRHPGEQNRRTPMTQTEAYERFRALHGSGCFLMPNAWDGTSAVLLKAAGFHALATSSAAISFGLGRQDGWHAVSLADSVANGTLMTDLTGLPVNGDLEDGYGPSPEDCAATVRAAIAGGLAGLGIEDTTADPAVPIHGFDAAVARVRRAAEEAKGRILLTGRTDNYLHGRPDLDDTIRRLVAFAEVGADVLYAPALPDMAAILAVVKAVAPKPVNVLLGPRSGMVPFADLAAAGVRRVSLGGALYRVAMRQLDTAAKALASGDIVGAMGAALPTDAFAGFFPAA